MLLWIERGLPQTQLHQFQSGLGILYGCEDVESTMGLFKMKQVRGVPSSSVIVFTTGAQGITG